MSPPTVLLTDEPVASLDPEDAAVVMDLLFRGCIEEELTVLCTLHQVDLAMLGASAGRFARWGQGARPPGRRALHKGFAVLPVCTANSR
jgi:ABC-type lipoprotein export system ATPase subunit